jgi:hypothetical protein
MASNINPNNIDGAYPVAGQDNDSQGFRDNFTNTKTNFSYASEEISDLQAKAVLKSALTGTTLNNNMNNSILSNAQLLAVSAPRIALGTVTSATVNFNASPYYTLTLGGATTTVSFTNFPSAGQVARVRLQVTVSDITYTLTLPASVSVGTANTQGFASSIITFNRTGVYEYEFETSDGGTTFSIFDLNQNRDPVYLPSKEDVASTAAINLGVTSSYFTTGGSGETATLANGTEGQVKVLAMYGDGGGNMVVTVASPGWGGSGTITFDTVGDACTLQFINGKWFCVGNNACAFA